MRRNGCQRPYSLYSLGAWLGQILALVWYAVVQFGFAQGNAQIISATIWSVLLAGGLIAWLFCQVVDPANASHPGCVVISKKAHEAHYCAACKKSVPGIDHHCLWLNTCVGSRTYFSFYLLSLLGGLLFSWQIVSLCLLMSPVWGNDNWGTAGQVFPSNPEAGYYAVTAVGVLLSLPCAAFYSALFLFHTYLIYYRNMTTYEYFIDKHTKQRQRRKAREEKVQLV
ncbi:hypothetical protein BASA81_003978 [Batrachochytrium salamandrivorans]|nr:hypothetical protein BASA81_003978 [Batrachochytrium salamandrivorans]